MGADAAEPALTTMARRNAATCGVRRAMSLDELRKLAGAIGMRLTQDREYREDLVQEALLEAVALQGKMPDMPSGIASKAMFRRMLRRMERDRRNKRCANYRPEPKAIADVWPDERFEPVSHEPGFARAEAADFLQVVIGGLAEPDRALASAMLANDCAPTEAGRMIGFDGPQSERAWKRIRRVSRLAFAEAA